MKNPCVLIAVLLLLTCLAACKSVIPEGGSAAGDASSAISAMVPAPGSTENPPQIPHEVASDGTGEDCLVCHRNGDDGATKTPHPWLIDCQQCHIPLGDSVAPFKPSY